ncbi:MAG: hypothetical protein ABI026_07715 [Gemmatimonadaceae bacterium]
MDATDAGSDSGINARQSPFYDWLDNARIRELVRMSLDVSPGERLVLIKGLVPGLVEAMGLTKFEEFLSEVAVKAHRYQEAADHPGKGRTFRAVAGEKLGGPIPGGHDHIPVPRNPSMRGAREAERIIEGELWLRAQRAPEAGSEA